MFRFLTTILFAFCIIPNHTAGISNLLSGMFLAEMNKCFEELFQNVNVIQNVAFSHKNLPSEIFTRATPGSSRVLGISVT